MRSKIRSKTEEQNGCKMRSRMTNKMRTRMRGKIRAE